MERFDEHRLKVMQIVSYKSFHVRPLLFLCSDYMSKLFIYERLLNIHYEGT